MPHRYRLPSLLLLARLHPQRLRPAPPHLPARNPKYTTCTTSTPIPFTPIPSTPIPFSSPSPTPSPTSTPSATSPPTQYNLQAEFDYFNHTLS